MIEITSIVGQTGFCPVEGCVERHGTMLVYFESSLGTTHPSMDSGFLQTLADKLINDGFPGTSGICISKEEMQNTAYVSIDMGTELAEYWAEKFETCEEHDDKNEEIGV